MATRNSIDTQYPVEVAAGGQGNSSLTAYTVLCGGTTATNPIQTVSGTGTSGQLLLSNGAGLLPSWQSPATQADFVWLETESGSPTSSPLVFTLPSTYSDYVLIFHEFYPTATTNKVIQMQLSVNGGSSYVGTTYYAGVNYLALGSSSLKNVNVTNGGAFQLSTALSTGNPRYYARFNLFNVNNGGQFMYTGESLFQVSGGGVSFGSLLGWNGNNLTVDTLKIFLSDGAQYVGRVALYGLAKS